MCTVSVVPIGDGFRLISNRDERLTRPVAEPPGRVTVAGVDAIFPVDPQSGGTWIGGNEAGLAIALLNRTPTDVVSGFSRTIGTGERSRGEIVPRLLAARDMSRLLDMVTAIEPTLYEPFRIVAVWRHDVLIATADGARMDVSMRHLTRPIAFTSSSLGDEIAERLRMPLFDALVAHAKDPVVPQRVFHGHQWADCPAFSVRMQRADARTVSRAIVNVGCADVADHRHPTAQACAAGTPPRSPRRIFGFLSQMNVGFAGCSVANAARTFMVREGAATLRQIVSFEYEPLHSAS
jgi:hypothetical protein